MTAPTRRSAACTRNAETVLLAARVRHSARGGSADRWSLRWSEAVSGRSPVSTKQAGARVPVRCRWRRAFSAPKPQAALADLDDSKKLTERRREELFPGSSAGTGVECGVHRRCRSRPDRYPRREHRGDATCCRRASTVDSRATCSRTGSGFPGLTGSVAAGDRR